MAVITEQSSDKSGSLARGVAVFSSWTMLSRILGLVRDMLWFYSFPRDVMGAFLFAFRIPNTFRGLVAEGAANAAYVPVFSEYFATKSREQTARLIGAVTTVTVGILTLMTVAGIIFAPVLTVFVRGLQHVSEGPGPSEENLALTIALTRSVFPYLFLIGVATLGTGLLTALKSFGPPAFAPVLFNIAIIAACLTLRHTLPIPSLVIGVLIGGAAQLLLQVGALAMRGIRFRFSRAIAHPGVKTMGLLMLPAVFGQAIGEINLLVDAFFADSLGPEKVQSLYGANRLLQLPLGVFGVAISTVALSTMSTHAARGEMRELLETLRRALRMACFMAFPASVGLIVLRVPVIRLLFQHGAYFDETATAETARALVFYLMGMASFAAVKTAVSAFYAIKETRVPVTCASISMLANVAMNFMLVRPLQLGGLALATTLSFTLNLLLLMIMLRRRLGPLGMQQLVRAVSRIGVSTAIMGVCAWIVLRTMLSVTSSSRISGQIVQVGVPLVVGLGVYLACCRLFRIQEIEEFLSGFLKRYPSKAAMSQ